MIIPNNSELEHSVNKAVALLCELSPLQRMINSPGLDKAFEIIEREFPNIAIHEYPVGSKCGDWEVPSSWEVKSAYMKDSNGKVVASIDESPLFVSPFSEPIEGWFLKEEIENNLTTDKTRPDVFILEHRNAYNFQLNQWGITLPYNRWANLKDGKYFIKIDVERAKSPMKVAELFLPGDSEETLCLCAHIDELCNDDLSGCVTAMETMRMLEKSKNRKYSYQMLLSPELIGTIFYLGNNPNKIKNTFGMINIEMVGAGESWNLKHSLNPESLLDNILKMSLDLSGVENKEIGFFEGYGNDERVYSWPPVSIPSVSLQKYPFFEYHSSLDTPEIIDPESLKKAILICSNLINIIENNYVPFYTDNIPPYLSKRNLYFDRSKDANNHDKFNNQLLFNIDGRNNIVDLCKLTGLTFSNIVEYLGLFYQNGILGKRKVSWIDDEI
ncbi:DUF4910 domain-containing protein [Dehalococcoidia bacterium]|nr:DUF4910 domain-containing protein [Dehalococcoidia bacterium]